MNKSNDSQELMWLVNEYGEMCTQVQLVTDIPNCGLKKSDCEWLRDEYKAIIQVISDEYELMKEANKFRASLNKPPVKEK
jgi:hypothetical protein